MKSSKPSKQSTVAKPKKIKDENVGDEVKERSGRGSDHGKPYGPF